MSDAHPYPVSLSFDEQENDDRSELTTDLSPSTNNEGGDGSPPAKECFSIARLIGTSDEADCFDTPDEAQPKIPAGDAFSREKQRLELEIAEQNEKLEMLSTQLRQSQAEVGVLEAERTALVDEVVLERDASERSILSSSGHNTRAGGGQGGSIASMRKLLHANAKLTAENARLQVSEDNIRKSFRSHVRYDTRGSQASEETVEALRREDETLRQLPDPDDSPARTSQRPKEESPARSVKLSTSEHSGKTAPWWCSFSDLGQEELHTSFGSFQASAMPLDIGSPKHSAPPILDIGSSQHSALPFIDIGSSHHSAQDGLLINSLHSIPEKEDLTLADDGWAAIGKEIEAIGDDVAAVEKVAYGSSAPVMTSEQGDSFNQGQGAYRSESEKFQEGKLLEEELRAEAETELARSIPKEAGQTEAELESLKSKMADAETSFRASLQLVQLISDEVKGWEARVGEAEKHLTMVQADMKKSGIPGKGKNKKNKRDKKDKKDKDEAHKKALGTLRTEQGRVDEAKGRLLLAQKKAGLRKLELQNCRRRCEGLEADL